jgi:hypothetical protein
MALAVAVGVAATASSPDPAQNLARVRLVVSTAATAGITISGATLASYNSAPLDRSGATRTTHTGSTLQLSRGGSNESADGRFDIVLADVPSQGTISWNLTATADGESQVEVYSINDLDRPVLVDRFSTEARNATFATKASLISAHSAVRVAPFAPKLVLTQFYTWYTATSWNDPQFADHPLARYSTFEPADVTRLARQALGAGVDAFVVSWLGSTGNGGDYDRRMSTILDAVAATGLRACVMTETFFANASNTPNSTDAQTMLTWLTEAVDLFGSHPAYLRVRGRPVIVVYAASQLDPTVWADVMERLRAGGRNPLLVGDFFHSRHIEVFDAEYQYSNVTLAEDALRNLELTETLRVRTFNLLRQGDRRRIWMASVTPGYDDRLLADRPTHVVVDRADGRVYEAQWSAAVDMAADWVMLTSWNEWFENTEIEPSERYGTRYLDLTRSWTSIFKGSDQRDAAATRLR